MNTHSKGLIAVVTVAFILCLFPQDPVFGADYTITDLGALGGTKSEAWGINNLGEVVGRAWLSGDLIHHAFLYTPSPGGGGVMTDLGVANCTDPNGNSWARRINNSSQIAGVSCFLVSSNVDRAFLFSGGVMQDLGTLGGTTSNARGINNTGHVVGIGSTLNDVTTRAFFYDGVTMNDLGTLWGEVVSGGYGINDTDQIVGGSRYSAGNSLHAFLYQNNAMTDLTPSLSSSLAYDINNAGQVVGTANFSGSTYHAFLYSETVLTDLGALAPGALTSEATAINNQAQIVGYFVTSGGPTHAFLYESGVMTDLNDRLPVASGWVLNIAADINDSGHIVGWGTINGQTHAFLMVPVVVVNPPTATTGAASNVTSDSATLNGTVNPNGIATTAYFEWGTSDSYGNQTTNQSVGGGTGDVNITADLAGLLSNTTYHYRVVAISTGGTANGNDATFQTGACPPEVVTPTSQSFSAQGGASSVDVTASCSWTAVPSDSWIIITSGGTGNGNGTINYTVESHSNGTSRAGTITVGAASLAVMQGAQYADVPTDHPFHEYIGKMSARGVTGGCGGGNYCPDASVTREQMAIFIERGLGVFTPPPPPGQTFDDVPTSWYSHPFIEDFSTRGITAGCSVTPKLYCPGSSVTREQMAIFIERAIGVFTPPTPPQQTFEDVPTDWFSYPFIEDFVVRGITAGCSVTPKLYCPSSPVTRGQMAVFLVRAFGL